VHLAGIALALLGCATPKVQVERLQDGILHFSCQAPLPECLASVEVACERQRYAVLRAFDDRNLKGDTTVQSMPEVTGNMGLFRSSEAFVRCDRNAGWSTENQALRKAPLGKEAAAAPMTAAQVGCTPGAAVACVGVGGCKGGQICVPDGSRLGPCECGPPQASPAP
jgi:hypothetical protein